ncbi:APC family permease [Filifactor villosus]|uniref:APC family permease n=1 Tax=Filifactor villosus TaxID=29374 RepID=A0ABV9QMT8_9FIRM
MSENKFKKELGLFQVIAMAAGGMIAAWMVEIKLWFELSGVGSSVALITCAVLVLSLCLIYAELTGMLPYAGGANIWISNSFGWNSGWLCFWCVMLLYIMAMPTVSYGIASMLGYLFPVTFLQVKIIAAVILLVWFILTNFEIKFLARIQNVLFWSTLVVSILASITFIGSEQWSVDTMKPIFPEGFSGYSAAVGLLIMKFVGFDLIPQLSEETNFPRKKLILAFIGSLFLTVLIYGLAVIGVGGIVSQQWIAETDIVDPRVADIIGKHWLGVVLVVMGTGTCLTTLSGFWLSASRTLYGAAKQRQFPIVFAKINKNGQPHIANILVGVASVYFTVFAPETWVNYIYTIYGIAAGLVYLMVVLSFLKLRKKQPNWERPFYVKHANIVATVGVLFCVWVLIASVMAMEIGAWFTLLGYAVIGIGFWLYARYKQKSEPDAWKPVIINPENTPINSK